MSLFDKFRKKQPAKEITEKPSNFPEMLMVKLLYSSEPVIQSSLVVEEIKKTYPNMEASTAEAALLFTFPDIKIQLEDAIIPAQHMLAPLDANDAISLPDEAFQQNWHWEEAKTKAAECKYGILATDFMTRTLEYHSRHRLFMTTLIAAIKVMKPTVVYSVYAQKLMSPDRLAEIWETQENGYLDALLNVRLFNITGSTENEMIMDTIGLYAFGLPDLQVRFSGYEANQVGKLLWDYAYYIFDNGDVIKDGNTVMGVAEGSKWKCQHEASLLAPYRQVINIMP